MNLAKIVYDVLNFFGLTAPRHPNIRVNQVFADGFYVFGNPKPRMDQPYRGVVVSLDCGRCFAFWHVNDPTRGEINEVCRKHRLGEPDYEKGEGFCFAVSGNRRQSKILWSEKPNRINEARFLINSWLLAHNLTPVSNQ